MTKVVHNFQKNALEEIRVAISEFKGKKFIDIRTFYKQFESDEEYKPTKKGITMPLSAITDLEKAVQNLKKELSKEALQTNETKS